MLLRHYQNQLKTACFAAFLSLIEIFFPSYHSELIRKVERRDNEIEVNSKIYIFIWDMKTARSARSEKISNNII